MDSQILAKLKQDIAAMERALKIFYDAVDVHITVTKCLGDDAVVVENDQDDDPDAGED